MRASIPYLLTRWAAAAVLGLLAGLATGSWYLGGLFGGVALVALLVLRRSGRYLGTPQGAVLARDERGRTIADRAARNGFVVLMLTLAAVAVAGHALGRSAVPLPWIDALLALAGVTWLASDLWQRRG